MICIKCNKRFNGNGNAKYCPNCLRNLALNSSTPTLRSSYTTDYNSRKDCQDKPLPIHPRISVRTEVGEIYESKTALCKEYGITYTQLYYRLLQGYTIDNAIKKAKKFSRKITVFDKQFKNKYEVCKYYGVNYNTFMYHYYRGKNPEKIIEYLLKKV